MNRVIASVIACTVLGAAVQATPIAPGGSVFLPAGQAPTPGVLMAGPLVSPVATPTFTGTLTSSAYIGDPQNIYGGITFYYQFQNDPTSQNGVGHISNNGFTGFLTDVSWILGSGFPFPFGQNRSIGAGDTVGSDFGSFFGSTPIMPGQTSVTIVVHTNATLVTVSNTSIIDGFTDTVPSLAPLPTPGAAALMGMGLLASARRRRV